jgi:hypothetical protein
MGNLHTETYYNGEREYRISIEEANDKILTVIYAIMSDGSEMVMDHFSHEKEGKSLEDIISHARTTVGLYPHLHDSLHSAG